MKVVRAPMDPTHAPGIPLPLQTSAAPSPLDEERRIVARVLDGDHDAFEVLVRRHGEGLFRYLHRLTGSREDAEDCTQEAFAKAFSQLGRFDARRSFKPWLYRIGANLALSHLRGRRVISLDELGESDPLLGAANATDPRDEADAALRHRNLLRALGALPPEARGLLYLQYDEGMSINEIAAATGKRPGAVKVALHRARMRLRDLLSDATERKPS